MIGQDPRGKPTPTVVLSRQQMAEVRELYTAAANVVMAYVAGQPADIDRLKAATATIGAWIN